MKKTDNKKEVLIKGVNLKKTYIMGEVEINALDSVDFEIHKGELLVILGPSGSGKSTMLNIIGGMDSPTGGELYFEDTPVHEMNKRRLTMYRRKNIGFIFQFYNLLPNLTALENVDIAREISESSLKSEDMLAKVGLSERKNHFPSQLSGGEQQRVAIARALAKDPDVFLCDEPTGALDSKSSKDVLRVLHNFCREFSKTVIIITHNNAIASMADRIMVLRDGRIIDVIVNENPADIEDTEI
ncbi:MAG: ABC transporter ATP-binding protein [Proteocatella sp.]|nr:ABC transporter ATP-binding protein [Proteocatella sp.]MBP9658116.1 ABC transporter ATP-binding protein [Proteocatella sp.]MBP9966253.1 ABC transporter ATP-binding protein [Proteocatella sp.]NCB70412.1 ABC transporter ATP-binding protein [Clostridia bacterium]